MTAFIPMVRLTGRCFGRKRSTGPREDEGRGRARTRRDKKFMQRLGVRVVQHNKTALVTGASRAIGRATALALAETGAHVLVHYGRSVQEAQSLVESIQAKGGRADAIRADLGTPEGATLLAKEVRSIVGKQLDVLVSNAGISKAATIKDHTVEDFDNLFATNVRSPFFLVQQLLPILGEGSNIIVISSIGAHAVVGKPGLDNPSVLAYASTKGALETLVKNWAAILGSRGIRVNAVAPGVIDTDMSNFAKTEAGREATLGMQALKRIGKPEDVADVVAFLASDKARWITGASIPVDGGSKL
jgi:3-oxoacyl-[acyl-carrier protein] reductase